ncbi:MAG: tRNA pseudouridine synthase B [Deltaproteobacteria bacterium ADurb.Bin026]|nr:tRNA pseudouridine(55) synthase TruB [Syntrophorhabdaceae bacterium]MDI9561126.1 tRNA pseudouridine(55) synthase TruB [Pseudomonadota bacterium]OQC47319.1 MAG: tRNA pseudouridine synthase B [Deltaproteobacteria bacterium ADurb.Bin026]MBV6505336.1 tRNA pseudouridine synthase B [Syntrophorhabdaceae bacterium]HNQ62921.1 tRNA pseudouridine(55) synthase TruB [Syntrophorhabdaceae bacterium]
MNGFLIVDKQTGMSSYDVIRRLKKISSFKKIGYIGTLDRNATGVLPVAINEGVKLIPFFEDGEKAYRAKILLGVTTDTYDIAGNILTETNTETYESSNIQNILNRYKGKITQQVPLYSSKKVHRKPLYKLVRQGIPVEAPEKEVEIFSIKLVDYSHPYVDIYVTCSKGTYIRSLANDLGLALGCGATLYALKRTLHGEFSDQMSVNIEDIKSKDDILNCLISLENVLKSFRDIIVEEALERFLKNGMPVPLLGNTRDWSNGQYIKMLNRRGHLIGIGVVDTDSKTIKIKRLIKN